MKINDLKSLLVMLLKNPGGLPFRKIRTQTKGYLAPEVYQEISACAARAGEGIMIDIGPAQGGSTLSIGLGIRKSGKKESLVYSIEKGVGSDALKDRDNPELNGEVLRANVAQYGLSDIVEVLIGGVEEVHQKVDATRSISLLFIDADGALDRDFSIFYNRLLPNSPIILDDVKDEINRHAIRNYLAWTTEEQMREYVASKGATTFLELTPLGKEYTTFQFTKYFIERGLIVKDRMLGSTFFGRKTNDGVFDPDVDGKNLLDIRKQILAKYYGMNPNLTQHPE